MTGKTPLPLPFRMVTCSWPKATISTFLYASKKLSRIELFPLYFQQLSPDRPPNFINFLALGLWH